MAQPSEVDVTLEEACTRNGLTLVAQVTADIGTTTSPPDPGEIDVVTSPTGPALIVGNSGTFVLFTCDEALDLADALAEAVATARNLAADPMVRADEHARRMVEALGLVWEPS